MVKADFWLLFFIYFVSIGTGITVLNNLAQIAIAQDEEDTTTLLSIFSFCNFVGRLGGGVVSKHFVRTKLLPRTFWLTCTQTIMILVYLLFAFAVNGSLYPAVAFLGVCYDVQVSIMIPTVSELFGLKNFGVLGNVMSLGNPLGGTIFLALLAVSIYDKEAKASGKSVQSEANLASYPIKNLQGQNFMIPVQPVNFSFKPCATSDIVGGNSKTTTCSKWGS